MTFSRAQIKAELTKRGINVPGEPITRAEIREELTRRGVKLPEESGGGIGRGLAMGARDIAAGVGDVADLIMTPVEMARYGIKSAAHKIAPKHVNAPEYGYMNTMGPNIAKAIDTATGGYTEPQTEGQRTASAIGRALTSLPTGGGIGVALGKAAPKVGKALVGMHAPTAGNIGATAGASGLTHQYLENNPDAGALDTLGMGALGSVLGGHGASYAAKGVRGAGRALTRNPKDTLAEYVGSSTGFDPKLYQKGIDLDLAPSLGMASHAKSPTEIEALLYRHPGSGPKIEKIFQQRENKLAQHLGLGDEDLVRAVEAPEHALAKQGAKAYKERKGKEYQDLMEKFQPLERELHEQHRAIDVRDILDDIEAGYKVGRKTPSEVQTFNERFPGKVYNKLQDSIAEHTGSADQAANRVAAARKMGLSEAAIEKNFADDLRALESGGHGGASYRKLVDLQDEALDKMNATKPGSVEHKEATHMHKLLREKVDEYIDMHGDAEQVALRKQANKKYSHYASKKQSNMKHYVEDLLNTDDEKTAFNKLTRNPKYLEAASKHLSKDKRKDLAEAIMATTGKAQDRFSIAHASSKVNKWSPQVRQKYMELLPTAKAQKDFIGAMHFIGENKAKIQKIANTSGTAHTASVIQRYKDWLKSIGGLGGAAIGIGGYTAPIGTITSTIALDLMARGTAHMFTDPVFLDRINRVIKAKNAKAMTSSMDTLLKAPSVKQMLRSATINPILGYESSSEEQ